MKFDTVDKKTHKVFTGGDVEFSESLIKLRTAAAATYELGLREGMKPEELMAVVKPITDSLHKIIVHAVKTNLAGVVVACRRLETEARGHESDIEFLKTKATDARYHSDMLKKAIADHMTETNVTQVHHKDYMVTKTKVGDKEIINLR